MKTKSKTSGHIVRGSVVALFFIFVIVALSSAINMSNRPPKASSPQSNTAFGMNAHESASSVAAPVEFRASRQRVGGREIAGFSARQARAAQEENLQPRVELKPRDGGG